MIAGKDPQLEKAIELALEALKKNPPKKDKRPAVPEAGEEVGSDSPFPLRERGWGVRLLRETPPSDPSPNEGEGGDIKDRAGNLRPVRFRPYATLIRQPRRRRLIPDP